LTLFVGYAGNMTVKKASQGAGLAAVAIAVAALIGWWARLPLLSSWGSGFPHMKPVTALCLTALGLALIHPGKNSRFAVAVGLAVAAVGLLTLIGVDFGVNQWLVPRDAVLEPWAASSRKMTGVPLVLAFAGSSLVLSRFEKHRFAAALLGGLAGVMPAFALLTYVAGVATLRGSVSSPALPTAVGMICAVGGIILQIGALPPLRKPRPLWHLLILLACAIIVPLLLLAVYTGFRITDAQLDQAQKDLMNEARTLSAEVDHEILGEIKRLQALAASPSLRQGDLAEFQRQAEASLAIPQNGSIVLIDRNMRQLVNTWVHFGAPLEVAAVPEAAEAALATGKPQITGLFTGPVSRQLSVGVIVPVQIDGKNRYALDRSLSQRVVAGLIAAHELPPGWQAVVSDATHHVIARSGENAFIGTALPPVQQHRTGPGSVFEFVDSEGRPSLGAYAGSGLTGWKTAVWEPKNLVEAPVRALWWTVSLTALLSFAIVLALALWLGRIIAHSVSQTARAAIALGEGDPLPSDQTPVAEVNTLMNELREAAARRTAAEDSLRESEAIFRAMFDVSSVGKLEVELGTARILRANAAMCKFVGYSEAELLARTALEITHPDDRDRSRELGERQAAGEPVTFDVEKRFVRRDGKAVWSRTTVNIIRDASGRPLRHTSVIQDIDARKLAEQALQASKDRLQLALDATELGSWQYDPLRRTGWGDARANEVFDLDIAENEEVPIEVFLKRVHPDDVERVWAALATALDPADPRPLAIEYRIRRGDGKVRWVANHGLAYFEYAGRERRAASFVGTVADITERKEREEKEHLLMREVSHRAKNMLSVVDAIAHQTATRNPDDFIERFSERIQALSANQDLLVRNEWNGVEIADLIRAQLAHFVDLIGSRIAVRGPALRLTPASAQAIGLALHELATNAGKYGALSTDAGRVDISWGAAGDTFTMSWTEREGPPASPPTRRGFGTIVMEAMAERSLGGTVELDYAHPGLTWRLACPAANALERREHEQNPVEAR
jgi:PAS domain S-box-containing protein